MNAGLSNSVVNSYIGVGLDGGFTQQGKADPIPNQANGVTLEYDATYNSIGGEQGTGALCVISGNSSYGVALQLSSTSNEVEGDYIGLASGGAAPVGNTKDGVWTQAGSDGNTIGSTDPEYGDAISANGGNGVTLNSNGNVVDCNFIGLTSTGADPANPVTGAPHYLYNQGVGVSIAQGTTGNVDGSNNRGQP